MRELEGGVVCQSTYGGSCKPGVVFTSQGTFCTLRGGWYFEVGLRISNRSPTTCTAKNLTIWNIFPSASSNDNTPGTYEYPYSLRGLQPISKELLLPEKKLKEDFTK